jgi:hypothetical protein
MDGDFWCYVKKLKKKERLFPDLIAQNVQHGSRPKPDIPDTIIQPLEVG